MFLQYAIWGAWLPLLFPYLSHLKFDEGQIGNMFAIGAVGALLAPFIAGQIADRFFATQKFLGISHLIGAAMVWQLGSIESYDGFLWFSLIYSIVYAPTLPLTNSLAFHHLKDRDRDFGRVRVWGTVGWIVVGIGMAQWLAFNHSDAIDAGRADAFRLSAVLGLIMGIYCFFLPDTPPSREKKQNAFGSALKAVAANRSLLLLFLISIPVSCIHQFYFVHTAGFLSAYQSGSGAAEFLTKIFGDGGGGLMTLGQMSEIGVLALIPLLAKRWSRKTFLLIGLWAYAARMALFAYHDLLPFPALVTLSFGVILHGLCFGAFIFVAFMIVDEECGDDIKASAQSLYNFVIIGIGVIVGSKVAGSVAAAAKAEGAERIDYTALSETSTLFSIPMWGALACFVLLLLLYPKRSAV